jgi:hypothetical protein
MLTADQPRVDSPRVLIYLRPALWLVVMVIVPTLLTVELIGRPRLNKAAIAVQNNCLIVAIVVCAIAGFDWLRNRAGRGATFAMLAAGSSALVALLIIWNKLFRHYIATSGYTRNTFRGIFHNIYAPLYGRAQLETMSWWWVVAGVAAGLLIWEALRKRGQALEGRASIWRVFLFQLVLTLALAGTESTLRVYGYYAGYRNFAGDLPSFTGISDVLRNYVERMPTLSHFGSHYPPGFLILLMVGKLLPSEFVVKSIGVVLPALTILPLHALAGELQLSRRASGLAGILLASSAGVLIFPTLAPVAMLMFLSCTCLWLLVRSLRRGESWCSLAFGLTFAIYVFFSFASYMLAILMGMLVLFAILNKSISITRALRVLLSSITVFVVFFAALYLIWNFNIIECFQTAHAMHLKSPGHGFDHPMRYLLRATGGILAYLISTSFVLAVLAIAALRRIENEDPLRRAFTFATLLAVVAAGFSGMSYFETERLWLIFTPALAILAGSQLSHRSEREGYWVAGGALLMALGFGLGSEWKMRHHLSRPLPAATSPQPSASLQPQIDHLRPLSLLPERFPPSQ